MRTIPIELGGKTRHLRYDMNAMSAREEKLDVSLDRLSEVSFGMKAIRTMLWAGLLHEEPALTEWDVGAWVDGANFEQVSDAVTNALTEMYGDPEGNPEAA